MSNWIKHTFCYGLIVVGELCSACSRGGAGGKQTNDMVSAPQECVRTVTQEAMSTRQRRGKGWELGGSESLLRTVPRVLAESRSLVGALEKGCAWGFTMW